MSTRGSWREFAHTADTGIEVEAPSRPDLFATALQALAELMVEQPNALAVRERRRIEASGADDVEKLHDLLAAALNLFLIDGFIWSGATVAESNGKLVAELWGEPFDRGRHRLRQEVKAVTYHQLAVEPVPVGWRARCVRRLKPRRSDGLPWNWNLSESTTTCGKFRA